MFRVAEKDSEGLVGQNVCVILKLRVLLNLLDVFDVFLAAAWHRMANA